MARYAGLLRGVSPSNAKMAELARSFEDAGFEQVATVLSSGNVVFGARAASAASLEKRAEAAMAARLGRAFPTIVRPVDRLREILATDPYASTRLPTGAKRIVTFLRRAPTASLALPITRDGATIVAATGAEVYTAYVPSEKGAAFMTLIEETFGVEVTTRTWDTVAKIVAASDRVADARGPKPKPKAQPG